MRFAFLKNPETGTNHIAGTAIAPFIDLGIYKSVEVIAKAKRSIFVSRFFHG